MKDESLLLPPGLIREEHGGGTGGPRSSAPSRKAPPPANCEEVLARLGPIKKAVYAFVRNCVDELEEAAPWELLYYPPEDPEALLAMIGGLVLIIRGVPERVDQLLRGLPMVPGGADEPAREDIGFLLHGIHRMVTHDLKRLSAHLESVRDRGPATPATPVEGQRLCELAADLKGKYASSLMGAAANLVGEGMWEGVELEPVLFPEKAEEFRCTRELVVALNEAIAAIRQLPEQIPFAEIVERWRQGRRIDQYALADLPSLRGKIGRLLKARSRRALYSGDYHQISRREVLLSQRINELERLHQKTWAGPTSGDAGDLAPVFTRLEELALEVAAVLDTDILKSVLGGKKVDGLRGRAAAAGKQRAGEARGTDALAALLAEDDLRIFFEMLLAAVQRRAALAVREEEKPAEKPAPKATPAAAAARQAPPQPKPTPPPAPPAPAPSGVPAASPPMEVAPAIDPRLLARIFSTVTELQSPTHTHWSSFRMTQRLLEKHARIPLTMFHGIHPFLQEIRTRLIGDLKAIAPYKGLTRESVARLDAVCRELCESDPEPAQFADEVPRKLERIVRFLDGLRALTQGTGG